MDGKTGPASLLRASARYRWAHLREVRALIWKYLPAVVYGYPSSTTNRARRRRVRGVRRALAWDMKASGFVREGFLDSSTSPPEAFTYSAGLTELHRNRDMTASSRMVGSSEAAHASSASSSSVLVLSASIFLSETVCGYGNELRER